MTDITEGGELRHRCRACRGKLRQPVENPHHAFCCRFCFDSFYFSRCRVCERDLRKQGRRGDASRLYCRPPRDCKAEARKWLGKYEFRAPDGLGYRFSPTSDSNADSTGIRFGFAGSRPAAHCLLEWCWGDPLNGTDLSLYDRDGLTIARIIFEGGTYRLGSPVTWPPMSWPDLKRAKRGAESIALAKLPLDPRLAARIKRDNESPNPIGGPLDHAPPAVGNAVLLTAGYGIAESKTRGNPGPMPAFLRRATRPKVNTAVAEARCVPERRAA